MNLPLTDIDDTDNLDVAQYIDLAIHGVDSSDSDSDGGDEEDCDRDEDVNLADSTSVNASAGALSGDVERGYHSPMRKQRRRRKASKKRSRSRSEEHNPVVFVADTVREVGGAVLGATSTVVGATTGLLTAAVAHAPILNKTVKAYVHR